MTFTFFHSSYSGCSINGLIVFHVEETTMKHRTMKISCVSVCVCVCVCVCVRGGGVLAVRFMSSKDVEKGPDGSHFLCMEVDAKSMGLSFLVDS